MRVSGYFSGSVAHPLLGQTNFEAQPVRDNPDGQVADTIKIMSRYVLEDANCPNILADAAGCLGCDEISTVSNDWGWVQRKIQFQRDEMTALPLTAGVLAGQGDVVEVLIRPRDMATSAVKVGDCDDYSMYLACLLTAQGIPATFVTVAGDDRHPNQFTHIYVAAYPMGQDGQRVRVPLDSSHGKSAGWEALQVKPRIRMKEWRIDSTVVQGTGWIKDMVEAGAWAMAGWVMWQLIKGRRIFGV